MSILIAGGGCTLPSFLRLNAFSEPVENSGAPSPEAGVVGAHLLIRESTTFRETLLPSTDGLAASECSLLRGTRLGTQQFPLLKGEFYELLLAQRARGCPLGQGYVPFRDVAFVDAQGALVEGNPCPSFVTAYTRFENGQSGKRKCTKHGFTLQEFLAGTAPFVAVAVNTGVFPEGVIQGKGRLRIPELDSLFFNGKSIDFRIVDNNEELEKGDTFWIDVCVAGENDLFDARLNRHVIAFLLDHPVCPGRQ